MRLALVGVSVVLMASAAMAGFVAPPVFVPHFSPPNIPGVRPHAGGSTTPMWRRHQFAGDLQRWMVAQNATSEQPPAVWLMMVCKSWWNAKQWCESTDPGAILYLTEAQCKTMQETIWPVRIWKGGDRVVLCIDPGGTIVTPKRDDYSIYEDYQLEVREREAREAEAKRRYEEQQRKGGWFGK
jgi:hypothetical protein